MTYGWREVPGYFIHIRDHQQQTLGSSESCSECASLEGRNAQNLRFAVDTVGVIRPAVAPDFAVAPADGTSVSLVRESGRADQRWRAGAN